LIPLPPDQPRAPQKPLNPAAPTPGIAKPPPKPPGLTPPLSRQTLGQPNQGGFDPSRSAAPAVDPNRPLPVAEAAGPGGMGRITAFGGQTKRHEDSWARTPNTTGSGAIHVKTFHCKLTDDALSYLDQTINGWLDAHPQYEVKFVSSSIGILTGKLKEPALICQVWV
jgi:hypothetical protein